MLSSISANEKLIHTIIESITFEKPDFISISKLISSLKSIGQIWPEDSDEIELRFRVVRTYAYVEPGLKKREKGFYLIYSNLWFMSNSFLLLAGVVCW